MTSNAPQTMKIETALEKDDRLAVKVAEIPLPPVDQWEALDNSGDAKKVSATDQQAPVEREIAQLNFDIPTMVVQPLDFPFTHPVLGHVTEITVRRLTVGAVGNILDGRAADAPDMFDIYAVMTGVPAPVLRGLIDVDGERVTGACFDFLPRLLRPVTTAS
ncbi:hypothetical protein [Shinella zoogloeoides]|uniref:Phage tail assembly protein n=1 Tax=Shinella zoogloeoides TaxID=352475 RepID=A0A6N8TFZ3_SHIZO|nr:hypothetical protein [Shinella zoogloeoides]MXO01571.1 hypothetical protein [Shinella zoogloeoides]UEX80191.1 hypothetical protein K8M09_11180 [Shinella zoogloeoides]